MNTISILVKIAKNNLDQTRIKLELLNNKQANLQVASEELDKQLLSESLLVNNNQELIAVYQYYFQFNQQLKDQINNQLKQINIQISQANEQLFNYFAEIKKYELALSNKQQQANKKLERLAELNNDELIINRFRQKNDL